MSVFCEKLKGFTFSSFIASQAKQHKLKNHTFCNILNVTLSRLAVTAYNNNTSTRARNTGWWTTDIVRSTADDTTKAWKPVAHTHGRTNSERLLPMMSRHCFLHLQIKKIDSLGIQQQYAMCRVGYVIYIACKFRVKYLSRFSFDREALSRSKSFNPSELTGRDDRRSVG